MAHPGARYSPWLRHQLKVTLLPHSFLSCKLFYIRYAKPGIFSNFFGCQLPCPQHLKCGFPLILANALADALANALVYPLANALI